MKVTELTPKDGLVNHPTNHPPRQAPLVELDKELALLLNRPTQDPRLEADPDPQTPDTPLVTTSSELKQSLNNSNNKLIHLP